MIAVVYVSNGVIGQHGDTYLGVADYPRFTLSLNLIPGTQAGIAMARRYLELIHSLRRGY